MIFSITSLVTSVLLQSDYFCTKPLTHTNVVCKYKVKTLHGRIKYK